MSAAAVALRSRYKLFVRAAPVVAECRAKRYQGAVRDRLTGRVTYCDHRHRKFSTAVECSERMRKRMLRAERRQ